jgi:hypothetical protein
MGLGLSISRTIVEVRWAHARQHAEGRRGCAFHAAIRVWASPMTPDACCVHVIDDDASWRKSVQRLLAVAGRRARP